MKNWRTPMLLVTLALFLAAPISAVAADPHGGMKIAGGHAMAKKEAAMPAATGKDLWSYLQQVKYRESFTLWPGKGKLYKGREPHGALLTTYVNEYALAAIQGKKGHMAAESIVVKENYKPDKTLAAITVMYKVAGFDPAGGSVRTGGMLCFRHRDAITPPMEEKRRSDPDGWVDLHGDALFRFALIRMRDRTLAEDLVQETLLAAFRGRDSFSGRFSERTWLIGILKNKIADHFRRKARESSRVENLLRDPPGDL